MCYQFKRLKLAASPIIKSISSTLGIIMILCFCRADGFSQTTKVSGKIINASDSIITISMTDCVHATGEPSNQIVQIKLKHNGVFNVNLQVDKISKWRILNGSTNFFEFVLEPGKSIKFELDSSLNSIPGTIQGPGKPAWMLCAALEEYEAKVKKDILFDSLRTTPIKNSKSFWLNFISNTYNFIDTYAVNSGINKGFVRWLKSRVKYGTYLRMIDNSLYGRQDKDYTVFEELHVSEFDDDYSAANCVEYNTLIDLYVNETLFKTGAAKINVNNAFDFGNTTFKNLTKEYFLCRKTLKVIGLESVFESIKTKFLLNVKSKQVLAILDSATEKYTSSVTELLNSKAKLSDKKKLSEIFSAYKGKVIYVDFWASWCGPCKEAMPYSAKLKSRLKSSDIIFLYLGFQDQLRPWLAAIKDLNINGEHVLLNKELIEDAFRILSLKSIPSYIIVDKDGSIVERNALPPNDPKLVSLLTEMCEN